jgi:radical SAM protein with 4Fe4S-binding SPASM domain
LKNTEKGSSVGTCRALKDHIGILSNLDVVACCLDANGDILFGNLNNKNLQEIVESKKFQEMKYNLDNNIKTEDLCKNCNFYK